MANQDRRKQRKMNEAARTARRRKKAPARAEAAQLDPSLPMTRAEILAAQEAAAQEMIAEGPPRVEHGATGRTVHMTPAQAKIMRLQMQLFRVVFGREPGPHDPIFWDTEREREGVFPLDEAKMRRSEHEAFAAAKVRPELAYAAALTGMGITDETAHLFSKDDLAEWQAAIDDYRRQAATGVLPLAPDELIDAWDAASEALDGPAAPPASFAHYATATKSRDVNRLMAALQDALGSGEKAVAALERASALMALADSGQIDDLVSQEGFDERALVAAASAEIDSSTRQFRVDSFRARLPPRGEANDDHH